MEVALAMLLGSALEPAAGLRLPPAGPEPRGRYDFAAGLTGPRTSRHLDVVV
jgi:hypothetical protein